MPTSQAVRSYDPTKLKYKLTDIQLENKMMPSKELADKARCVYMGGKQFVHHLPRDKFLSFKIDVDMWLNIKVYTQRQSK